MSLIQDYINLHAANTIKKRATQIHPRIKQAKGDSFLLSYKGSSGLYYSIKVNLMPRLKTSCTCPFEGGGLCKHEVAALMLIDELWHGPKLDRTASTSSKRRSKPPQSKKTSKHNLLKLDDGDILSDEVIQRYRDQLVGRTICPIMKINSYEPRKIDTQMAWGLGFRQKILFKPRSHHLDMACECESARHHGCAHILGALEVIQETYGSYVFTKGFPDDAISDYASRFGLTPEDDYEDFFEFIVDENGIKVISKIEGMQPLDDHISSILVDQGMDELSPIESTSLAPHPHEVGLLLETSMYDGLGYLNLQPILIKYRKGSTKHRSNFIRLDLHHIISRRHPVTVAEEHIMLDIMRAGHFHDNIYSDGSIDHQHYKKSFDTFHQLINAPQEEIPFYHIDEDAPPKTKHLRRAALSDQRATIKIFLEEKERLYEISAKVMLGNKSYKINSQHVECYPYYVLKQDELIPYAHVHVFPQLLTFLNQPVIRFLKKDYARLHREIIAPLSKRFEIVHSTSITSAKGDQVTSSGVSQVYLSDYEGTHILFKLAIQYEGHVVGIGTKTLLYDEDAQVYVSRDLDHERAFEDLFRSLHSAFHQQSSPYHLSIDQVLDNHWMLAAYGTLQEAGVEVYGMKELKSFNINLNKPTISTSLRSDIDWFDMEIQLSYGDQVVSLRDVRKAIVNQKKYVPLKDGSLGLLPEEWIEKFAKYFRTGEVTKDAIRLSNYQFNIVDDLYDEIDTASATLEELKRRKERLNNLSEVTDVKPPDMLQATLRSYQQTGLNWLVFLHENLLGGCLADDMGLGKTLQVISLFAYLKTHELVTAPHLVVAPTSLMYNWGAELEKFCPDLSVLIYTSVHRHDYFDDIDDYDVVITTYGSIMQDIEKMKDRTFDYVVLDESQAIKNPNTKRYKAVRLLQAHHRLALTGTPIENNTFDLYAQMNFLNPGLLGSMANFKSQFATAIDKHQDEDASDLLRRIIHPFILRRTKAQVAKDLPPKTESILYCEMGAKQRKTYDAFREKYRNSLLELMDEKGEGNAQIYILEGLTKLRQICNSPALLSDDGDYGKDSIKLDILMERLQEKTRDHKVLVFSQFTSMLALIKARLEDDDIKYEYLDGQTRHRQAVVDRFQDDDSSRVFLISLKAGGTGLNLTKAEYVFLVDPWWNPAVENQAIDRSYRIGQTRHVFAYRMICVDSIEEKIIKLQDSKRSVSEDIIRADGQTKSFNKADVAELFS